MGSLLQVIAGGEGFDRAYVIFYPPKNGIPPISYELLVEPNPLTFEDKYAVLRMILFDSMNRILWAQKVYKGVKTAIERATDYEAIDVDEI